MGFPTNIYRWSLDFGTINTIHVSVSHPDLLKNIWKISNSYSTKRCFNGFTTLANSKIITIEKHFHNQQRTHHWKPLPNVFRSFPCLKYLCHQMHSFGFFHRCISAMKATKINRKTITTRQGIQGNPQLPDCWRSLQRQPLQKGGQVFTFPPKKGHVCKNCQAWFAWFVNLWLL